MQAVLGFLQCLLGLLLIVGMGLPMYFFGWLFKTKRYQRIETSYEADALLRRCEALVEEAEEEEAR